MPGRSCVTNLGCMLRVAWNNISAGSQTDVVYTDFSSAFQSVNHQLLAVKMEKSYHVTGKALSWLKSYLSEREQRVCCQRSLFSLGPCAIGHARGWAFISSSVLRVLSMTCRLSCARAAFCSRTILSCMPGSTVPVMFVICKLT